MALTFQNLKAKPPQRGGWRSGYADIVLDGSYATGGWAITAANLKLTSIYNIVPPAAGVASGPIGAVLRWDHVTGKLLAFQSSATETLLPEIDAGDLNGEVIRCYYEGS